MLYGKKRKTKKGKLSGRLARAYASFFAGLLFVLSVAIFFSLSGFLIDRQKQYIVNTIELVSDQIVEEIYEGDTLDDDRILAEFNINWNLNMLLSDLSGNVVNRVRNFHIDEATLPPAKDSPQLKLLDGKQLILCYEHVVSDDNIIYGSLYFVLNMQTELECLKMLAFLLVGANVAGVLAAIFVGWKTSRKMLAPIDHMISDANTINSQRLNRRLDVPEAEDELQKLSMTINNMLDRMEEAFRLQGRFAADASHELRTPLSILQGNADMLERWGRNDPVVLDESITSIQKQTSYMNKLVDNLLFLARGDSGTQQLKKEAFDIGLLLYEMVEEQSSIDEAHYYHVNAPEDIRLLADRSMIKQLLHALIDNSVKYTPAGGDITLSCAEQDDGIAISVADTGIGMEPEHLAHVFERFYRVDQARLRTTGGMGLGLSIVKAIVDVHGGKLHADSEKGKGTHIKAIFLK
jgi:heavy metal sensor kinase